MKPQIFVAAVLSMLACAPAMAQSLGTCSQADATGKWIIEMDDHMACEGSINTRGNIRLAESHADCTTGNSSSPPPPTLALVRFKIMVKDNCRVMGSYEYTFEGPSGSMRRDCALRAVFSADRSRIDGIRKCSSTTDGVETSTFRGSISFAKLP